MHLAGGFDSAQLPDRSIVKDLTRFILLRKELNSAQNGKVFLTSKKKLLPSKSIVVTRGKSSPVNEENSAAEDHPLARSIPLGLAVMSLR